MSKMTKVPFCFDGQGLRRPFLSGRAKKFGQDKHALGITVPFSSGKIDIWSLKKSTQAR